MTARATENHPSKQTYIYIVPEKFVIDVAMSYFCSVLAL